MTQFVTVSVTYKCENQTEFDALLDHFGIFTPLGYERIDDVQTLTMTLNKLEREEIPGE